MFRRPDRQHLTHSGLSWTPLTWRLASPLTTEAGIKN
jgi:hypothetical protein